MATRKRIISQSQAAFAGPSPATGLHNHVSGAEYGNYINELTRVQSFSHSFNITRQDIGQFGQLAARSREIVESPTVTVDLSWYVTSLGNENKLGFTTNGAVSSISGFLNGSTDEKNLFFLNVGEGQDAINNADPANHEVTAIGNAFMSNYTVDGAVGQIPSASATFEALNVVYEEGSSGNYVPAIIPESGVPFTGYTYVIPTATGNDAGQPTALRPGDISLSLYAPLGATISGDGKAHIQSFSLSVPISREPLDRLGSPFSFSREIQFPVTVTLNVTANVADIKSGRLTDLVCTDEEVNLAIEMREPGCGVLGDLAAKFELRGAKLDSESMSSAIGSNASVDFSWSAQLGGPEDLVRGLFMSGSGPFG